MVRGEFLRCEKFVASAVGEEVVEMNGDEENVNTTTKLVKELQAQVDELQQKLNMSEQAIDVRMGSYVLPKTL